jgi:hypothetical protein
MAFLRLAAGTWSLVRPPFAPCSRRRTRYTTPAIGTWTAALMFSSLLYTSVQSWYTFFCACPSDRPPRLEFWDQSPKMSAHFLALGSSRPATDTHRATACMCCQHARGFFTIISTHGAITIRSSPQPFNRRHRHRWHLDATSFRSACPTGPRRPFFTIEDAIQAYSHDVRSQKLDFATEDLQKTYITIHYKPREFRNELRKCDLQTYHVASCGISEPSVCRRLLVMGGVSVNNRSPTFPIFPFPNLARYLRISLLQHRLLPDAQPDGLRQQRHSSQWT